MAKAPFLATPYNIDPEAWSAATALACKDPTRTKQEFRDECNINVLFAKYLETGEIPQVLDGLSYGNFEGIFDFQTAMNAVRTAEGVFGQLPARIKNRFDNDPQKMLEFLSHEENRAEAEFLGLVNPEPEAPIEPRTSEIPAATPERQAGDGGTPPRENPPATTQKP